MNFESSQNYSADPTRSRIDKSIRNDQSNNNRSHQDMINFNVNPSNQQMGYPNMPMMVPVMMPNTYLQNPINQSSNFQTLPYYQNPINQHNNLDTTKTVRIQTPHNNHLQTSMRKSKYKVQSKEQTIQRFYDEILPFLTMKRLRKLQAYIRSWYTRKVIVPRKKLWNALQEDYTKKKINEWQEEKIIPDIIIETLRQNKYEDNYSLYSPEVKAYIEYLDELIHRVVKGMSKEVVNSSVNDIVKGYMRKKEESLPISKGPQELVLDGLIENVVRENCREVTKQAVWSMTDEYIIESQFITFFRRCMLKNLYNEVLQESINEIIFENYVDELICREIDKIAEPLALKVEEEEYYANEDQELDGIFGNLINRIVLDSVLDNIDDTLLNDNVEYIADMAVKYNKYKDFTEDFLDEIMMDDTPDALSKLQNK